MGEEKCAVTVRLSITVKRVLIGMGWLVSGIICIFLRFWARDAGENYSRRCVDTVEPVYLAVRLLLDIWRKIE